MSLALKDKSMLHLVSSLRVRLIAFTTKECYELAFLNLIVLSLRVRLVVYATKECYELANLKLNLIFEGKARSLHD